MTKNCGWHKMWRNKKAIFLYYYARTQSYPLKRNAKQMDIVRNHSESLDLEAEEFDKTELQPTSQAYLRKD